MTHDPAPSPDVLACSLPEDECCAVDPERADHQHVERDPAECTAAANPAEPGRSLAGDPQRSLQPEAEPITEPAPELQAGPGWDREVVLSVARAGKVMSTVGADQLRALLADRDRLSIALEQQRLVTHRARDAARAEVDTLRKLVLDITDPDPRVRSRAASEVERIAWLADREAARKAAEVQAGTLTIPTTTQEAHDGQR